MQQLEKNKLSDLTYFFLAVILGFLVVAFPPTNILCYDVFGYYMYLPFKFKYNDIVLNNFQTVEEILKTYKASETFYQGVKWHNGNWIMRYPIGLSVMYSPFYFIADAITPFTSHKADGFSKPYQLGVLYGCLIYTLLGLYFVKRTLQNFFSDGVTAITLLCIGLGTNYFFHTSMHGQGAMSHNILFTLYAAVIYYTIRWHQTFKWKYIIIIGICTGLAALCRASEIIIVMIPLLYGITDRKGIIEKIKLLWNHKWQIIFFAAIIIGIGFIQFGYWMSTTGEWVINPYASGNPGEGLELTQPHILEVLFSFRKGWFIYTPMMLFTMYGFWLLYKKNKPLFTCILFYFLVNLYIVSSWSCWWYGSCFGNRALIASYAILSVPLAYAVEQMFNSRFKLAYIKVLFIIAGFNLFQIWQMTEGVLDNTNMSRAYYFSTFLQTTLPTQAQTNLLLRGKFNDGKEKYTKHDSLTHMLGYSKLVDFENEKTYPQFLNDTLMHSGKFALSVNSTGIPSYKVEDNIENITKKAYTWIKGSVWLYSTYPIEELNAEMVIHMQHRGYYFKYMSYKLTDRVYKPNTWCKMEYYYLTPDDLRSKKDTVGIFFLNSNDKMIIVDDLKMESYEPIVDQSYF